MRYPQSRADRRSRAVTGLRASHAGPRPLCGGRSEATHRGFVGTAHGARQGRQVPFGTAVSYHRTAKWL